MTTNGTGAGSVASVGAHNNDAIGVDGTGPRPPDSESQHRPHQQGPNR